ncbi:MAG: hypothetical protein ACKPBC_00100 [Sphaerospermopsis kisseleviana]
MLRKSFREGIGVRSQESGVRRSRSQESGVRRSRSQNEDFSIPYSLFPIPYSLRCTELVEVFPTSTKNS